MSFMSRSFALAAGAAFHVAVPAQPDPDFVAEPQVLDAVTVSATPLGSDSDAMAKPADTLGGYELTLKREATLGDTLTGMPGIHADTFGAGASRPVIRGQAAPRVKVLSGGSEVMDASSVSPDHAIVSEPMLARRVEVLRGPSALLYGGDASGGVVNVVDDKIPEAVPQNGVEGFVELRGATGSNERAAAFGMTAGQGNVAVHLEGLKRRSLDYRVPDWPDRRLPGSFEESGTGSVGVSWIGSKGFLGVAYTRTSREYGLPGHSHEHASCHPHGSHLHCDEHSHHAHDHHGHAEGNHVHHDGHGHDDGHEHLDGIVPFIKLRSDRFDVRGEYREPFAGIRKIRFRGGFTDYRHDEIENGWVATTFKNRGYDTRVEVEHRPVGGWRGVVGVQGARSEFSAVGEESFLPATTTRNAGIFMLEEYRANDWRFEVGARHEWQSITPRNAQSRSSLTGTSVSGSATWDFAPSYSLALSLSRTQRLPTAQELYADGVHLATNTYEIGNADLARETSRTIDLSLRKHVGDVRFTASVFHSRIRNYIYANTLDRHEDFRLIEYTQGNAKFTGMEAQASYRLNNHVMVTAFGDVVRGKLTGGNNLPRIPAVRAGARVAAHFDDNWSLDMEAYRVFRQSRVANDESETPGYNMVNLGVSYDAIAGPLEYTVYLRATNLLDKLALNHASFVSSTAPLPGRRVLLGVRVAY